MPAFSFKEQFCAHVVDGSKTGTIRTFRKHPIRVGQLAHLYYAMRTKQCRKLRDPIPIHTVQSIAIFETDTVVIIEKSWLTEMERMEALRMKFPAPFRILTPVEMDALAWADGFRNEHDPAQANGCFQIMKQWFGVTHGQNFVGNYIKWL